MSKKDVFISYKSEEFKEAETVKSILEANGISCWMAPMSIKGGSSYAVEIPEAIQECDAFVLILSEVCQTSRWVPREINQAINEGKTILPFMLEECSLKKDFSFYLTNVQCYKAYEDRVAALEMMIGDIRAILGRRAKDIYIPVSEERNVRAQRIKRKNNDKKNNKKSMKLLWIILGSILGSVLLFFILTYDYWF